MSDDFIPNWDEPLPIDTPAVAEPPDGMYVWPIKVWEVEMPKAGSEKPFLNIFYIVTDGPFQHFKSSFRLYITAAAKTRVLWFLRKFEYPAELLPEGGTPLLRRTAIIGLTGKALAEVDHGSPYAKKIDFKGFERIGETELEEKIAPKEEESIPTIDIHADAQAEAIEEAIDLSFLDEAPEEKPFEATDEDLPF